MYLALHGKRKGNCSAVASAHCHLIRPQWHASQRTAGIIRIGIPRAPPWENPPFAHAPGPGGRMAAAWQPHLARNCDVL